MDNGKRGTGNWRIASQAGHHTFGEQGLSAAEFAFKRQNRSNLDILRDFPAYRLRFSRAVGNECSHVAEVDAF